jgi:hypothetical protein
MLPHQPRSSASPAIFPTASKPHLGRVFLPPGLALVSNTLPIAAADFDNRLITVTARLSEGWDKLTLGDRFYVENLLEELDQPGEWCFDPGDLHALLLAARWTGRKRRGNDTGR